MRVARGIAAAIAGAALVLGLSGCGNSPPEITDAQVAAWKEKAAQTIPAATDVTIEPAHSVNMIGGASNSVHIYLVFANFSDLKASEQAIFDLQDVVQADAPGASITASAANAESAAHEADLSAQLEAGVPGISSAKVFEGDYHFRQRPGPTMGGALQVYVDDVSVLTPSWLDQVSGILQTGLEGVDGGVVTVEILPPSAVDLAPPDPAFTDALIRVKGLEAFKD
jgi:hypothetical protein